MKTRAEVTGRKMQGMTDDADAYSIEEFCRRHGFSSQLFYKMRAEMPATFKVGVRVLISREAAAVWRHKREEAAART